MWKPIDLSNLPKGNVLAVVIEGSVIVGEITFGPLVVKHGVVCCEDRTSWIFLPTHYFDPRTLVMEKPVKSTGIEPIHPKLINSAWQTILKASMSEHHTINVNMIVILANLGPLILAAPKQTKLHLAATKGNCFQTCIGAVMNKPVDEVPAFQEMEVSEWATNFIHWIYSQGWEFHGAPHINSITTEEWEEFPFMVVGGRSPRGIEVGHAVIYFNGAPYWDPHPSNDFILTEEEVYLIRPAIGWDRWLMNQI